MGEKKKHGENMSIEIKTKEELLEALYEEANKPVDELDADEISRITELLEQMDEDKHTDTSDYEEFLQRFNDRNDTDLTSSSWKKNQTQKGKVIPITKRLKGSIVAAASLVLAVIISSSALSIASSEDTAASWVTGEGLNILFHVGNTKYDSFLEKKTEVEYVQGNPNVIKMQVAEYNTTDLADINKYHILMPNYYPDRYVFKYANVTDLDSIMLHINLSYKANKDDYLSYFAMLHNTDEEAVVGLSKGSLTEYIDTIRINDFDAYIYQEKEKLEARFCYDGVIYQVGGFVSYDELCDILEDLSYSE